MSYGVNAGASAVFDDSSGRQTRQRRVRRLHITPDCLVEWFSDREYVPVLIENPLPEDVMVVGAGYDLDRDQFVLFLKSDSFDEVAEGAWIPFVSPDPVFRSVPRDLLEPLLR